MEFFFQSSRRSSRSRSVFNGKLPAHPASGGTEHAPVKDEGGFGHIYESDFRKGGIQVTKEELIASISEEVKIPKLAAEKILDAFTHSVTKALKKGDKLTLTGFGTFSVARRKGKKGRNFQTGSEIKIPPIKLAKFKAGNLLKSEVK